jgi:site-specific DNA-methyltransferase (adenine-specific)
VAAIAESYEEAVLLRNYMRTKLFRFLVSLRKITQDNKSDVFSFAPDLPMDVDWTDAQLYSKYGVNEDEKSFIDSMIRTVEWRGE